MTGTDREWLKSRSPHVSGYEGQVPRGDGTMVLARSTHCEPTAITRTGPLVAKSQKGFPDNLGNPSSSLARSLDAERRCSMKMLRFRTRSRMARRVHLLWFAKGAQWETSRSPDSRLDGKQSDSVLSICGSQLCGSTEISASSPGSRRLGKRP